MLSTRLSFAAAALAVLLGAAGATADSDANGARITATVLDAKGGPGPSSAHLTIHVDHWADDSEVVRLAGVLKEQGPEALQAALEELDGGWLRVGTSLGYPIAVARSLSQADGGRTVRVLLDRPLGFFEVARGLRSEDYPLALLEIHFDAEGNGEGTLAAAVKAHFEGTQLVVESYGARPFRVIQARVR